MSSDFVLELKAISKQFGPVHALSGVDFKLRRGEIHALAGENGAGKSTLMHIVDGILQPDDGEIVLRGKLVTFRNALDAQRAGIGFVHQEIALCSDISVAENVMMATTSQSRKWLVDYKALHARARQILAGLASIDPQARLGDLSISNQQVVEIAKALALDAEILILDEPTSALTERESNALFKIMHQLKARGISIIFISHRLAETFQHCDHITVLRDGRYVMDRPIAETSPDEVVGALVGRKLNQMYPAKLPTAPEDGEVVLEVDGLGDGHRLADISFKLHKGEVLGIAGLIGAGRTELAQAICGLRPRTAGTVRRGGEEIRIRSYSDAVSSGIVYLSEDRKAAGIFLHLSIAHNVSALQLDRVSTPLGLIDRRRELEQARRLTGKLNLKSGGMNQPVSSLSGGNQQKVALAKLLSASPSIIIVDEPTRGIDVGAKSEIHMLFRQFADDGVGIIVISSDLPEIVGLCDRVLVMAEGRVSGVVTGEAVTEENIIALASHLRPAA